MKIPWNKLKIVQDGLITKHSSDSKCQILIKLAKKQVTVIEIASQDILRFMYRLSENRKIQISSLQIFDKSKILVYTYCKINAANEEIPQGDSKDLRKWSSLSPDVKSFYINTIEAKINEQ